MAAKVQVRADIANRVVHRERKGVFDDAEMRAWDQVRTLRQGLGSRVWCTMVSADLEDGIELLSAMSAAAESVGDEASAVDTAPTVSARDTEIPGAPDLQELPVHRA